MNELFVVGENQGSLNPWQEFNQLFLSKEGGIFLGFLLIIEYVSILDTKTKGLSIKKVYTLSLDI